VLDQHAFGHHGTAPPGPASRATVGSTCREGRPDRAPHNAAKIATRAKNALEFSNSPCTGGQIAFRTAYPHARSLLITADADGSNGPRLRLWKWDDGRAFYVGCSGRRSLVISGAGFDAETTSADNVSCE
jgi:hypothetical protein